MPMVPLKSNGPNARVPLPGQRWPSDRQRLAAPPEPPHPFLPSPIEPTTRTADQDGSVLQMMMAIHLVSKTTMTIIMIMIMTNMGIGDANLGRNVVLQ